MKNLMVLALLLGASQSYKLRIRDDEDTYGYQTAANVAHGIDSKNAFLENSERLPSTIAPSTQSTLERRARTLNEPLKPINPIYDVKMDEPLTADNIPFAEHHIVSGYHGADEDEIMTKVFNEFSQPEIDTYGNKSSQKLLLKDKAKRSAEVILEATHKLKEQEVPAWIARYFENSWNHFDQNNEGFIRIEEAHTFMRHLMGRLNKFSVAPGSIADVSSGGAAYPLSPEAQATVVGEV